MTAMQGIQWMLAEMHASIEACRWWTYRVASKQDEGDSIEVDSAALKLFVVPTIQEVAYEETAHYKLYTQFLCDRDAFLGSREI